MVANPFPIGPIEIRAKTKVRMGMRLREVVSEYIGDCLPDWAGRYFDANRISLALKSGTDRDDDSYLWELSDYVAYPDKIGWVYPASRVMWADRNQFHFTATIPNRFLGKQMGVSVYHPDCLRPIPGGLYAYRCNHFPLLVLNVDLTEYNPDLEKKDQELLKQLRELTDVQPPQL